MMKQSNNKQQQFWARLVMRKWLHMGTTHSDYPDDDDDGDNDDDSDSDSDYDINQEWGRRSRFNEKGGGGGGNHEDDPESNDFVPKLRRQKSLTSRTQYINKKELRVCVGTWNVGGKLPPEDQDIDDWLDIDDPADIYVLGLQEIVPLNPGNIFGPQDTRPVPKWENIIRVTLNRVRPPAAKMKSFSDPPSPSKFKPLDDMTDIEEEMLLESDSDIGEEVHPLDEEEEQEQEQERNAYEGGGGATDEAIMEKNSGLASEAPLDLGLQRQLSSPKKLNRLNCFRNEDLSENNAETSFASPQNSMKLTRMLSGTERIGLSWPEQPLHLLPQKVLDKPVSLKSFKSFRSSKSFRNVGSFKQTIDDIGMLAEIDLEALMKRKRRSSYVRIVSKQMVGIFITIWARRSLRKHIQNLKVSTVGVGVMGYIGNKGSISVSMSIYQTFFCFICTHLTAGEKEGDELRRNIDVREIHHRTHFHSLSEIGLPRSILDHERIIWLGDLNYRINLPYQKTRDLISKKQWSKLLEKDQLVKEMENGVFNGWLEGKLDFAPTYKYANNSEKYYGEDPKVGRRTPSWCDRILWYGKGMRLVRYRRAELRLSDHRPVSGTYMAEVEVFSPRKLQRALTFTDAEIGNENVITSFGNYV